jgi:hypothetical protein
MSAEPQLRFWRENGKWFCAIPRDDWATQLGFDWKHYGLIGHGSTKEAALRDWESWKRCSDLVADIY